MFPLIRFALQFSTFSQIFLRHTSSRCRLVRAGLNVSLSREVSNFTDSKPEKTHPVNKFTLFDDRF